MRVCVFSGSSPGRGDGYAAAARAFGRALVERGWPLVYGGGKVGLMGVLADAVLAGGGHVTGVIPKALALKEIAHETLSELRVVASMHERKQCMADLADAFVALPGGMGTLEETFETLTWAQLGMHRKPCGVLNVAGFYDGLLAFLDGCVAERFLKPQHRAMLIVAGDAAALLDQLTAYRPPTVEKWLDRGQT